MSEKYCLIKAVGFYVLKKHSFYLSFVLVIITVVISVIFLATGSASIKPVQLFRLLLIEPFNHTYKFSLLEHVVLSIKLPLLVGAILSGMAFGFSGALMQGLLRNPLADPGILGISSGGSLMVVLGLWFFSIPSISNLSENIAILILAMIGSALVLILMYLISIFFVNGKITGVLLAGVALASIFSSILMLTLTFSEQNNLSFALGWLMGSIHSLSWPLLGFDFLLILSAIFLLLPNAYALDVLSLGELDAKAQGVNHTQLLLITLVGVSIMMAVSVSIAGPVAFVGLIAPYIVRLFSVRQHSLILINSALTGSLIVIAAEAVSRNVFLPYILPLGAVTALIGAPFFLFLLWRSRKANLFV